MLKQKRYAPDNVEVGWSYLHGTTQQLALQSSCNHILLTGGRGWGKTEVQIMRFRALVGCGYGTFWRGIIFDREYKNLDDLITKSRRLFRNDPLGPKFLASTGALRWVWPTGEELLFRVAKKSEDYWNYHGHEYPFIGWNELTKYPSGRLYSQMLSTNRSGFNPVEHTPKKQIVDKFGKVTTLDEYATADGKPLPPIPLEVCSTTNPYGIGHNWVKRQFIDVAKYGDIYRKTFTVFNPATQEEEEVERTQVALFGTFRENRYLSPSYIAGMMEETDANILKAWLNGDWDIVAGGAFDDRWSRPHHVVDRFKIPEGWYIDRAMDWGSTHPYSVGWFAESNGEDVKLPNGQTISWPRGTLIQFAELYGTPKDGIGTNIGTKESAKDVATKVKEMEEKLLKDGWISRRPLPGPADNQISNVTERDTDTIEKKMGDNGVRWEKSDKAKGSRKNGFELIRDRLQATVRKEGPGLVFTANCQASISLIPVLPRDEKDLDDVDTDAEDHSYDMVRYRVLKGNNRAARTLRVVFPS